MSAIKLMTNTACFLFSAYCFAQTGKAALLAIFFDYPVSVIMLLLAMNAITTAYTSHFYKKLH